MLISSENFTRAGRKPGSVVAWKQGVVVVWTQGVVRRLGTTTSEPGCEGSDLNDVGVVVGACGGRLESDYRAYPVVWKGSTAIRIGIVFGDRGRAVALNDIGQVVGYSTRVRAEQTRHAFVWEKGRTTDLGTLGGPQSEATAINNHGQIIGWAETKTGKRHAVIWAKRS